jgi:uncharacterized phage protein (TIGR01671 family)
MNDRLKFRVWDKGNKRYQGTQDWQPYLDTDGDVCFINTDDVRDYPPENYFIIEQCTGLKDKNGNLIYEGDILLCDRKDVECATGAEIHYKSSGVVQREKNGKYFIIGEDWYGSDITFYNECAEIIGNIHEQAEQKDK